MILCHCHVVTDRTVESVVRGGARTLAGVCRSTRAGSDCGACVFSVKKAIQTAESRLVSATLDARLEEERHARRPA